MNRKNRQMFRNIREEESTNSVITKRICKDIINKRLIVSVVRLKEQTN